MGRWGKKRCPLQDKGTVADTWVTSSNTQLLRVFLVSLTFGQLSYYFDIETIYNQASKHNCSYFFWKVLNLVKTINLTSPIIIFMLRRLRRKNDWNFVLLILKVWSFPSVDQLYMFFWLKSLEARDGQVGCWYKKTDVFDQSFPVHNQGLEWIFIWIWCIYCSWKHFWM